MDTKSVVVTFRLSPAQHSKLVKSAKKQSCTVTQVILSKIQQIVGNP